MNIKKIISIILFIIAAIMISFGFYSLNSSLNIFSKIVSKSLDYAVNTIYSDDFKINGVDSLENSKINTNTTMSSMNVELLGLTGDLYLNSKEIYADVDSKLLGEDLTSIFALINSEKIYFKLEDVINKLYYTDLPKDDTKVDYTDVQLEKNDLKIITNHIEECILKDLEDSDFEKNSENLIINNKKYKTNRVTLNLLEKEYSNIIINLMETIMNDPESILVLQKINKEITQQYIKDALDEYKKNIALKATDNDAIEISFYISGISNVIRMEFIVFEANIDGGVSSKTIIIDNYKDNFNKKNTNIVYKENNKELLEYNMKRINDKTKEITLSYSELLQPFIIKGSYTKFSSSLDMYFELFLNNQKICDLSYEFNTINKNEEYEIKIESNIGDKYINSANRLYLQQKMPNIKVDNATRYEDMTQEEQDMFSNFIKDKLTEQGLLDSNILNKEEV